MLAGKSIINDMWKLARKHQHIAAHFVPVTVVIHVECKLAI
jgi:hypothetical protein